MTENKHHRMLVEFVRKEATPLGAIDVKESIKIVNEIEKISKKNGWECYLKGQKKDVLDYQPTNQKYSINTLEDIALLTVEQFEMFVDDLRNWCGVQKQVIALEKLGLKIETPNGMIWTDDGKHESNVEVTANITNKIN